ncbi:MAG: hypothetical protein E6J32_07525 [Chloroflexi bacterium]|nr:MAG: hypothetical protein E6J32_07525 [Chloroflexota bacterium]
MKGWIAQLAGALLVLVFAVAIGGFVLLLRAQQAGLAATMATAHIRAVSPPDGATNVPLAGEIRADYVSRPANDPAIKLEPPVGVTLDNPHWDGTAFVIDDHGCARAASTTPSLTRTIGPARANTSKSRSVGRFERGPCVPSPLRRQSPPLRYPRRESLPPPPLHRRLPRRRI